MIYLKKTLFGYDNDNEPLYHVHIAGTSREDKPTVGIVSGSQYLEVDTGKTFTFDGLSDSAAWNELVVKTATAGGEQ